MPHWAEREPWAALASTPSSAELKAVHEKLTHASHKLAEVLYKANAAAPQGDSGAHAGEPQAEAKKEGEVIDAEYVDVDDKK